MYSGLVETFFCYIWYLEKVYFKIGYVELVIISQKDEKLGSTVLMEFEMCTLLRRAAIVIII